MHALGGFSLSMISLYVYRTRSRGRCPSPWSLMARRGRWAAAPRAGRPAAVRGIALSTTGIEPVPQAMLVGAAP